MNTLLNSIRNSNGIISKVLKNNGNIPITITRSLIPWPWDLKITWDRPKKIPSTHPLKTGDLGINHDIKASDPAYVFGKCEEYKTADETVKKLLSLEYQPMKAFKIKIDELTVNRVKRHAFDRGSLESRIAFATSEIVYLQGILEKKRIGRVKHYLKELVDERQRYLRKLRMWDYKRFEFLIDRLNIVFKGKPEKLHKITRKDSIRKLTQKYYDEIVTKKMNAYKAELESQQKDFYRNKAEKLAFIRSEELNLGVEPSVTEEEIAATLKKADQLLQLK